VILRGGDVKSRIGCPRAIQLLALIKFTVGCVWIALALSVPDHPPMTWRFLLEWIVSLGLGFSEVISAFGLLLMKPWARRMTVLSAMAGPLAILLYGEWPLVIAYGYYACVQVYFMKRSNSRAAFEVQPAVIEENL